MSKDASPAAEPMPRLYRYREAAQLLGVSVSFLKQNVYANRIRSVLLATGRRIPASEIDRIVEHGLDAA
jgi:excisionase family DNA binding protein